MAFFQLQCGYRDGKKETRQDRDGLYTWCSRMSDRITSQARESTKQAIYCCISVQAILEVETLGLDSGVLYYSIIRMTPLS